MAAMSPFLLYEKPGFYGDPNLFSLYTDKNIKY